jgi:threonyl-tRNA synthetase
MLIEHFAAAFPLWLAPEQVRVLGLNDGMLPYAEEVAAKLRLEGLRVTVDHRSANVNKKIRDAQLELVPYMLVVGPKDQANGGVSVRDRISGDLGFMTLATAIDKLKTEAEGRQIRQAVMKSSAASVASSDGAAANEY